MKRTITQFLVPGLIATTAATVGMSFVSIQSAQAFTLSSNWTYVMDSYRDGTDSNGKVGLNSNYEIYGMAVKLDNGRVSVAFNSTTPIGGHSYAAASDGNITWGDLFFNFSGQNFAQASAAGDLYAIRFSGNNQAGVSETGIYEGVVAKSVATANSGYSSWDHYNNAVPGLTDSNPDAPSGQKGSVSFGELSATEAGSYMNNTTQNVIATGTRIGGIETLSAEELGSLNFVAQHGYSSSRLHTFGFSFDQSKLPSGDALLSIALECFNDSMGFNLTMPGQSASNPSDPTPTEDVPEPMTMAGLALGAAGLVKARRRRASKNA